MRREKKRSTQLADCGQNQEGPPTVFKSRGLRPWALLIGTLAPIRVVGVILFWSRHDFSRRCYWVVALQRPRGIAPWPRRARAPRSLQEADGRGRLRED